MRAPFWYQELVSVGTPPGVKFTCIASDATLLVCGCVRASLLVCRAGALARIQFRRTHRRPSPFPAPSQHVGGDLFSLLPAGHWRHSG